MKRRVWAGAAAGFIVAIALIWGGICEKCQAQETTTKLEAASGPMLMGHEDTQKLLHEAGVAYKEGKTKEAIELYEKLAELAPSDAALLYNLGTAYARDDQKGLAIWRYLQVLRLTPRDGEARANLRVVAPDIAEQSAVSIPPFNWIYERMNTNEWTLWAAAATLVICLLGTLWFMGGRGARGRGILKVGIMGAAVVAAACWPFALWRYYNEMVVWKGVVVAPETVARTGPSENQIETFALPEGTIVGIEQSMAQDWLKVSFTGGKVGYVKREQVRFL